MRFEFEHDFRLPEIPNLICAVKGHDWKKYQKPERKGIWALSYFYEGGDPTKQCDRCGETRYTKIVYRKIKMAKWNRYSNLYGTNIANVPEPRIYPKKGVSSNQYDDKTDTTG